MALAPSMDKIGPMARSAEDCARIFAAIAGHDPRDRGTIPIDKAAFTYSPSVELRKLRVAWLSNVWKSLEGGAAKPVAAAKSALRKFFGGMQEIALPIGPLEVATSLIVKVASAASFRSLVLSGKRSVLTAPVG